MPEETIIGTAPDAGEAPGTPGVVTNETVTPKVPEEQPVTITFDKAVGADGALAENWRSLLPENLRGEKCLDSIKNFTTLAQSYVHAQKSVGANKVAIPGEHATKEEWSAFYAATGRPEAADKYEYSDALPEGMSLDETEVKAFRDYAFEHGLSQKAYKEIVAYDIQRAGRIAAAQKAEWEAEYQQTEAQLKREFGERYDGMIAQCNRALDVFGLTGLLAGNRICNNPDFIKAVANLGSRISESKLVDGASVSGGDPQTRLAEIRNNPDDPYYKDRHPAHKARVEEVGRLLAALSKSSSK